MAMTGEITLRGRVLPVGGIQEKVLAAHRAGVRVVVLPRRCEALLDGIPAEVRAGIELVGVETVDEALQVAFSRSAEGEDRVTLPMQEPSRVSVH
jgi:ATP-dependent Lon protease